MPANYDSNNLPSSLVEGHGRFLRKDVPKNKALFSLLAEEGQAPKAMWVGCVDSRVNPDKILGADPGEILILRNVANIVPPFAADEASVGSAVHFAVDQLQIGHIVVCGHSDCGGIKALTQLGKGPMDKMLSSWVEYAISALEDNEGSSLESLIKTNVVVQSERLLEYPSVAKAIKEGRLAIHALYYDIASGALESFNQDGGTWENFV